MHRKEHHGYYYIHIASDSRITVDPPRTTNARLPVKKSELIKPQSFFQTTPHGNPRLPSANDKNGNVRMGIFPIRIAFVNSLRRRHFTDFQCHCCRDNGKQTNYTLFSNNMPPNKLYYTTEDQCKLALGGTAHELGTRGPKVNHSPKGNTHPLRSVIPKLRCSRTEGETTVARCMIHSRVNIYS